MTAKIHNLVFAVCHPDDEALWIGGTLQAISELPDFKISVICLSGNDANSPRVAEFEKAKKQIGYDKGIILGGALRSANTPLPDTGKTFEEGLAKIGLEVRQIDLLVTHSPYGDEHRNPHHIQTYRQLKKWAAAKKIPFGFFSCLQLPVMNHISLMKNFKRKSLTHLIQFSKCRYPLHDRIGKEKMFRFSGPKYFVQFSVNGQKKREILNCYPSINLSMHEEGYAAFTSNVESYYFFDRKGLNAFLPFVNSFSVPGPVELFVAPRRIY